MYFYGVTDLWTYIFGAIGIVLLPGPNSLYVLSVAGARGIKAGFLGCCGVFLGDAILLALTALGAASLLHTYPTIFIFIKYFGAAYLGYVGLNLIWSAFQQWRKPAPTQTDANPQPANTVENPFKRALIISLLNPKALLFLLSFFIQFIDPHYPNQSVPFMILSTIVMSFSAIYLCCLIFVGAKLASKIRQQKLLATGLSSSVGGLFVWFGAKLASASLH